MNQYLVLEFLRSLLKSWILAFICLAYIVGMAFFGVNDVFISPYWLIPAVGYLITSVFFNIRRKW
jgi:hypothetical protein